PAPGPRDRPGRDVERRETARRREFRAGSWTRALRDHRSVCSRAAPQRRGRSEKKGSCTELEIRRDRAPGYNGRAPSHTTHLVPADAPAGSGLRQTRVPAPESIGIEPCFVVDPASRSRGLSEIARRAHYAGLWRLARRARSDWARSP